MPPATRTSVPAAAMISVADCWSRMLSRLTFVAKDELGSDSDDEEHEEREEDPDPPQLLPGRPAAPARCRRRLDADAHALVPSPASSPNAAARIAVLGQLVAARARRRCARAASRGRDADEAEDLLELRGDERPRRGRRRPARRAGRRSRASRRRRRRASARRRSGRGARRAASGRTAPSAGCRPRASGRRPIAARRARRSARASRGRRGARPSGARPRAAERLEPRQRRVLDRPTGRGSGRRPCATPGSSPRPTSRLRRGLRAERAGRRRAPTVPASCRDGAEDGARELGPPRADEAGEADDLAGAHLEARVVDPGRPQAAHREHDRRVGRSRRPGRERRGKRAPEHRLDERRLGLGRRPATYGPRGRRAARSPTSARSSTSRRKWEIRMIVVPRARRASGRSRAAAPSPGRSSAADGSSMTISCVSRESARRISTCCCSAVRQASGRHRPGQVEPGRGGERGVGARQRVAAEHPGRRGSRPRKTFSATVSFGTTNGSWAIAATPCSSASRGERNETGTPSTAASPRRRRRARRRRSARGSTSPRRSRPTSACTVPRGDRERDVVERLDAAEVLGDVQELEIGLSCRPRGGRCYPGHSALNFATFALVTTPPARKPLQDVDAAAALAGLHRLDRALHRELPLGGRPLDDRPVPGAGGRRP